MEDEIYKFKLIPIFEMFYNDDSCFGVYKFATDTELKELKESEIDLLFGDDSQKNGITYEGILSGKMQRLMLNTEYDCEAKVSFNKKYKNYQYVPIKISAKKPTTLESQEKFLRAIVTKNQAEILLKAYPNIIQEVIDNKPIDLSKTKGIKERTFKKIRQKILENYVLSDILILLAPLGVTIKKIKILTDGEPNLSLLKEKLLKNPYILTKIKGLGFKSIDALALKINPNIEKSKERVIAFIRYYLNEIANSKGHTWIYLNELRKALIDTIPNCLEIYDDFIQEIKESEDNNFLHIYNDKVGLKYFYKIEESIFSKLIELNKAKPLINDVNIEKALNNTEKKLGFELTNEQKNTVKSIKDNNVIIITASAGAGKTTCTNAIIEAYKGCKVAMTALSAKAAQRMKEVTGVPAFTIHRLLGYKGKEFTFNEENPLPYQLIIIDEASMINSTIFMNLLSAVRLGCKVVIIFDFAQLPPIGAGNVATDLLYGNLVKINKFTKVHRQGEKSGILVDANKVRKRINPVNEPKNLVIHGKNKDMIYKFRNDKEIINKMAIKAFMSALKTTNIDDIVIITPRKKDCINSAKEINNQIQELLLKNEKIYIENKTKTKKFKLGAKIIQRKNNYTKDVVNGEMGYITKISKDTFTVNFGNNKNIEFDKEEMEDMQLAYCLTVHSCQGSQWNTIICLVDFSSYILLDKCLLYTAITRAEKRCMVIAEPKAFNYAVMTDKSIVRQTYLKGLVKNYKAIK